MIFSVERKFGKFAELDESVVFRTTISLPKKADKNKKHALTRAAKGGKTQISENFSEEPNVITVIFLVVQQHMQS